MAASYGNVCAQSCFQECGISHERMPLKHHKERLCFFAASKAVYLLNLLNFTILMGD